MAKKMLIDATHPEETRVVVVDGNKVEEFDFESLNKRQLSGNIYLAKVTRVEPSLQAAFVEYGGNRHGFLAFSEIHPDYYQIPKADREALLAEEQAQAEAMAAEDEEDAAADDDGSDQAQAEDGDDGDGDDRPKRKARGRGRRRKTSEGDASETVEAEAVARATVVSGDAAALSEAAADLPPEGEAGADGSADAGGVEDADRRGDDDGAGGNGGEAADDETEDGDGPEDGAADRTIAEGTGLEDGVMTEGGTASDEDGTDRADAPSGMDVVDLDGRDRPEGPVEDPAPRSRSRRRPARADAAARDDTVETVADDDDPTDIRRAPKPRARKYKIQEVVKVRQIMLVQVVKEERGNKGAALTTYLSLAGRYCVLMPNTARGGGISRKITNAVDRKKLKEIASEIDVPRGAGLIIRTAGAKRTKTEIRRDYEYLQRQWEQVRELTLRSIAPAPIYEEGNLIHRSIRDLYNRDIDEVIVEGEEGFRQAKDYMKLIMPSHAKNVRHYADPLPLFARFQVETYLDAMFNPTVQLRSGGYIVIGITEALVAIDVNSGRATKEGSIEETALRTNLEAAEEVARQAKLRDLAGLIVVDFIDMDERRNNAAVEKVLKDALKSDRARIQVGRISGFGLLEMSRQRLRPGMLEATTQPCHHCHGTGLIRSDDSIALQVLRALEEEGTRDRSREVLLRLPVSVANYLLNAKREHVASIEGRYDMAVRIEVDPALVSPDFHMEKFKTASRQVPKALSDVIQHDMSWTSAEEASEPDEGEGEDADLEAAAVEDGTPGDAEGRSGDAPREDRGAEDEDDRPRRKRRRRSRRRKTGGEGELPGDDRAEAEREPATAAPEPEPEPGAPVADPVDARAADAEPDADPDEAATRPPEPEPEPGPEPAPKPTSRTRSRSRRKTDPAAEDGAAAEPATEADATDATAAEPSPLDEGAPDAPVEDGGKAGSDQPPKRRSRARATAPAAEPAQIVAEAAAAADAAVAEAGDGTAPDEAKPKRRGWWSRG